MNLWFIYGIGIGSIIGALIGSGISRAAYEKVIKEEAVRIVGIALEVARQESEKGCTRAHRD